VIKVLLVDDDPDLLDLLAFVIQREGYLVTKAGDGEQALTRWQAERPDLVLLDINLPRLNGFEVCRRLRLESSTPVILLSARGDEADIVRGLQLGADDYVNKPFSHKQLVARIEAVLRRARQDRFRQSGNTVNVGDLVLDREAHGVTVNGESILLTRLQFRLLEMLAANAGRVVPYTRLVEYAWGYCDENSSALLKSHIAKLRRKLGLATGPAAALGIRSVAGVGYTLGRDAAASAA